MNLFVQSDIDTARFQFPAYFLNDKIESNNLKSIFSKEMLKVDSDRLLIIAKLKEDKNFSELQEKINFLASNDFKFMGSKIILKIAKTKKIFNDQKMQLSNLLEETPILKKFKFIECNIKDFESDKKEIEVILNNEFDNFYGHYHANKLLNTQICKAIYVDWGMRALSDKENWQSFKMIEIDSNKIIGFVVVKKLTTGFYGDLIVVDKKYQSKNIAKYLMLCLLTCAPYQEDDKINYIETATQLSNIHALNLFFWSGYKACDSEHVFHYTKI